ncbi:MAG: quinone-dependent dihydroorotate dehydrogenase [Cryobacterium sp.]|nr:quinone-dependent dihydroorotate dehydrogenase [Oligoflexia bacterium]
MNSFFWRQLRKIVFTFDAEKVHHFFYEILAFLGRSTVGRFVLRVISGTEKDRENPRHPLVCSVNGMLFRNPIGLAAGFDKDGRLLPALAHLGFGFAEIGTVTPCAQPGNSKPRLFRDVERFSLFNRMGFNSPGALIVSENVRWARKKGKLPENFRIGINIGKNKDTSAEDAAKDYRLAVTPFAGLADYIVVNVSSPNTPGLRALQTSDAIVKIVNAVRLEVEKWECRPSIYLKLAPELDELSLEDLLRCEKDMGIDGWVLNNTLGGYWKGGRGGWSGGVLGNLPRERLEKVRARSRLPIISVGGILEPREVEARLESGANLVQVYTGWIYFGPRWVRHLLKSVRKS